MEQEAQIRLLEHLKNHKGQMSLLALRPADAAETNQPEKAIAYYQKLLPLVQERAWGLMRDARQCFSDLKPELETAGIHIVDYETLDSGQQGKLDEYFQSQVFPVLTPLVEQLWEKRRELAIRLLESDPALSARLLRLVNSVGFSLRTACTSG